MASFKHPCASLTHGMSSIARSAIARRGGNTLSWFVEKELNKGTRGFAEMQIWRNSRNWQDAVTPSPAYSGRFFSCRGLRPQNPLHSHLYAQHTSAQTCMGERKTVFKQGSLSPLEGQRMFVSFKGDLGPAGIQARFKLMIREYGKVGFFVVWN
jgi:hypothetical protein